MESLLQNRLACPVCRREFAADSDTFHCSGCGADFPQLRGVPCLFRPGKEDLWAGNQNRLEDYFEKAPSIAAALETAGEDRLNGADLSAKAGLLQVRGKLREAAELHQAAWRKCYPEEYIHGFEGQMDFIAQQLKDCPGPVVDIASGRGMLISRLLGRISAPLAATDLSPSVLADYQASRWLEELKSGRLSLLAFDATEMPFRDGSLPVVTTCLGLQNIPDPEKTVRELRRVCGGVLYALCLFFPEDDKANQEAAARHGLAGAYSLAGLTGLMERCGWRVRLHEGPWVPMGPTPEGEIAAGMRVDALPVTETNCCITTLICE